MYNFKSSKGITMVALVITVILLFILAGVGINLGSINLKSTNNYKASSELNMVQHAILEQYAKYKTTKDKSYLVGNKILLEEARAIANEIGINLVNIPDTYSNKDYYRLDKASLTAIGITKSTDEYIVNYVSGEVINITKKKLTNNEPLYTRADNF